MALDECGMAADALLLWPGRYLYMVGVGGLSFPSRLLSAGKSPGAAPRKPRPQLGYSCLKYRGDEVGTEMPRTREGPGTHTSWPK